MNIALWTNYLFTLVLIEQLRSQEHMLWNVVMVKLYSSHRYVKGIGKSYTFESGCSAICKYLELMDLCWNTWNLAQKV